MAWEETRLHRGQIAELFQGNHSCNGQYSRKGCHEKQTAQLPHIVVKESGPTLLGRNLLLKLRLNWEKLYYMHSTGI